MEPADGRVELRFSDLGGMVCLAGLFLRLPANRLPSGRGGLHFTPVGSK
jgi:hypothetical protein